MTITATVERLGTIPPVEREYLARLLEIADLPRGFAELVRTQTTDKPALLNIQVNGLHDVTALLAKFIPVGCAIMESMVSAEAEGKTERLEALRLASLAQIEMCSAIALAAIPDDAQKVEYVERICSLLGMPSVIKTDLTNTN